MSSSINYTEQERTMSTRAYIPSSQNETWGFWGTLEDKASAAWPLAMAAIAEATGEPLESIRAFLDSAQGRHFGDEVHNGLLRGLDLAAAIDAATRQWMTWTITRDISKDYGIPKDLPYLNGFVISAAIHDNCEAA
jgi:hypothetical protein